jgi:hypothetical protein
MKGCDFLMTLGIYSSEIVMGEGISGRQEAWGISERLASGNRGINCIFRALAFSMGVVAVQDSITR